MLRACSYVWALQIVRFAERDFSGVAVWGKWGRVPLIPMTFLGFLGFGQIRREVIDTWYICIAVTETKGSYTTRMQ